MLNEAQLVDFADLILKPIALLQHHPGAAAEIRNRYRQILVDEYQDVNRASGVLLKVLAGDGKSLWVVGDARQSIYRFRGASPLNIRRFQDDFPGAKRLPLDVNYRSQAHVVRLVEAIAPHMRASAGGLPATWRAERGDLGGELLMEVATDLEAEAEGIAREISRRRDGGIPYRDQAILCRSHTYLARFAARLEKHGVPVLYLGDMFERPEVRDMLALLSFVCEPQRGGLLRVAGFHEYDIPLADARKVLAFAEANDIRPIQAAARSEEIEDLTAEGRRGLSLLAGHVEGIDPRTAPAALLFEYLLARSRYLDPVVADDSVAGQQRRLALYQLLQFVVEHRPARGGNRCRELLKWIRRLEVFGEERQLRQLPAAAAGIDAVRLLTVHASKGLEFRIVYLPALGTTIFPANPQYSQCPPPVGMLSEDPKDTHAEEEECLLFVATSRARDILCLSRAEMYGAKRSASPLLTAIATHLPRSPLGPALWRGGGHAEAEGEPLAYLAPGLEIHGAEDLDQYMRCPLSYLYQRVLGLSGARDDNAYVRFHRAVYAVLRWMAGRDGSEPVTREEALAMLTTAWAEIGPADHPYAQVYWRAAVGIVERAVERRARATEIIDAEWLIDRPGGRIKLRPDHVERGPAGAVVRRLRTGRPPKKIDDDIYALYHQGAARELPGARVEALYLTTDEVRPVEMSGKVIDNRLKKYDEAIAGIRAGLFPPKPNDRNCPRCPQYFICPAVPGSAIAPSAS